MSINPIRDVQKPLNASSGKIDQKALKEKLNELLIDTRKSDISSLTSIVNSLDNYDINDFKEISPELKVVIRQVKNLFQHSKEGINAVDRLEKRIEAIGSKNILRQAPASKPFNAKDLNYQDRRLLAETHFSLKNFEECAQLLVENTFKRKFLIFGKELNRDFINLDDDSPLSNLLKDQEILNFLSYAFSSDIDEKKRSITLLSNALTVLYFEKEEILSPRMHRECVRCLNQLSQVAATGDLENFASHIRRSAAFTTLIERIKFYNILANLNDLEKYSINVEKYTIESILEGSFEKVTLNENQRLSVAGLTAKILLGHHELSKTILDDNEYLLFRKAVKDIHSIFQAIQATGELSQEQAKLFKEAVKIVRNQYLSQMDDDQPIELEAIDQDVGLDIKDFIRMEMHEENPQQPLLERLKAKFPHRDNLQEIALRGYISIAVDNYQRSGYRLFKSAGDNLTSEEKAMYKRGSFLKALRESIAIDFPGEDMPNDLTIVLLVDQAEKTFQRIDEDDIFYEHEV